MKKWFLKPQTCQMLIRWAFQPGVDLLASLANAKLSMFYTSLPCPQLAATDALTAAWSFQTAYAFPSTPLIFNFLRRLIKGKVKVLEVIPNWPKRLLFLLLCLLTLKPPKSIPVSLGLPSRGPVLHPSPQRLQLQAWILEGRGWSRQTVKCCNWCGSSSRTLLPPKASLLPLPNK